MSEDWFEDELPWLGPPPQLLPHREQSPSGTVRRPLRRLPTGMPAGSVSASAAAVSYPTERASLRLPAPAVPPYVRTPQPRRYGELVALKWVGVLLILLAALTAFALIVRDIRSNSESTPQPTAQLVIPAAGGSSGGDAAAAIVPNAAFAGKVICLDAAHGGIDRGFRRTGDSSAPAMDEALYTAAYARELADQLAAMGFTVVLTRDGDTVRNTEFADVNRDGQTRENGASDADAQHNALLDEMQSRIDYCNDEKADLLISIHFDGSNDPNVSGSSTWYADGRADSADSQRLAELIEQQLTQGLSAAGYAVANDGAQPESGALTRGTQMLYDSRYMITGARDGLKEPSRMPGVIADLLTISNASDAQLLASEAGREAIVTAMAQAIGDYFTGTTAQG